MNNLVAIAYVISGILFILALRGLSSPESSRRGNIFGMLGMLIAVLATRTIKLRINQFCHSNTKNVFSWTNATPTREYHRPIHQPR